MLRFIYGVMGSSKSAQALITRYNYIQNKFNVILIKPATDTRTNNIKSRIGLEADCTTFNANDNLKTFLFNYCQDNEIALSENTIVIVDEAQFCTKDQIDELKVISDSCDVFCYGLKTNFKSEMFEGSKRLFEIADSLQEVYHICKCGKQAIINSRIVNGRVVVDGDEILIGDTEYVSLCYKC